MSYLSNTSIPPDTLVTTFANALRYVEAMAYEMECALAYEKASSETRDLRYHELKSARDKTARAHSTLQDCVAAMVS